MIFRCSYIHDGSVTESKGEGKVGCRCELPARQIMGQIRMIASTLAITVKDKTPSRGITIGGRLDQEALGAFVAGHFCQGEIGCILPRPHQLVADFHGDRFKLLVLGKSVVFIAIAHDIGVDDMPRFFDIDEWFVEGDEILCSAGPDSFLGEIIALVHRGPKYQIVMAIFIVNGLGRPGAASVIGGHLYESGFRPMDEVI